MQILLFIYVTLFGMVLGSFIGMAVVRIPQGESIVLPRSHCRNCSHVLSWYENIPIFSYLFLKGQCRQCHEKVSPFYLFIEVMTTVLTVLAFYQLTPWPRFLLYLIFLIVPMLILAFIDWEWLLLPDVITLPGIAAGFLVHWVDQKYFVMLPHATSTLKILSESLVGALAGSLSLLLLAWAYQKFRGKEGMGGGDIKLAAMIGAFFGWKDVFFIFFLASLMGILLGVLLIIRKGNSKETPLPFGTCLAFTAILNLFFGDFLLRSYLNFLQNIL